MLRPMLWYFFSMICFTVSSSLNVMKQKPLRLLVLFSIGSSTASTCFDVTTAATLQRQEVLLTEGTDENYYITFSNKGKHLSIEVNNFLLPFKGSHFDY